MTEAEWSASDDPTALFRFIEDSASRRKPYLFAAACLATVPELFTDERNKRAFAVLSQLAEGLAVTQRNRAAQDARCAYCDAECQGDEPGHFAGMGLYRTLVASSAGSSGHELALVAANTRPGAVPGAAKAAHLGLLHDIFGNPFRPVTVNPAWLIPAVVELAQTIYDDPAFDRLPDLADALSSAGCDNQEILDHCRSERRHVRGCRVVDLILQKG